MVRMGRLFVLASLLFSASLTLAAASPVQGGDDQLTLTISATCTANAAIQDRDMSLNDQMAASLNERATYRIVPSEGGLLQLELVSHKNSITVTGGGTVKSKDFSSSWSYSPGNPATTNVQGGVMVDAAYGEGSVNLLNFIRGGDIKADHEGGWPLAEQVADGTLTHATSTLAMPIGTVESNEQFIKDLSFTFDPKSQRISAGGQASYQFTFRGDKGPVGTGALTVSYHVQSGPLGLLEAVLIPKGDYEKWLPEAAGRGPNTPGNHVTFDVELRDPMGGKAGEKTAQFEIELLETSGYSGSCMNSPWTGRDPDLEIRKVDNPNLVEVSADGQKAKTAKGLRSASITISCLDGAAAGRLAVLAHIDGEDTILAAHLEGEPARTEVSIPCDSDGNTIADAWEEANGVLGGSLDSDEDTEPQGDGHDGDGLTVWEEYRGFLEGGKHIRTSPRKKDLFICDQIGGRSKRGIDRFAALSRLAVHDGLTREELGPSRVINRNRSAADAHVVDQHGLLLESESSQDEFVGRAEGGPGTPKKIVRVILDDKLPDTVTKTLEGNATKTYDCFSPLLAHELFHCCNVWHHGGRDVYYFWKSGDFVGMKRIFSYNSMSDCMKSESGHVTGAYHENGGEYSPSDPYWSECRVMYHGVKNGQHSGDEDCVMRYNLADAYLRTNLSGSCLLTSGPEEPVAQGLCTSPAGTGVNKDGRSPQSRYGNADAGRGACAHKICVNDLYH